MKHSKFFLLLLVVASMIVGLVGCKTEKNEIKKVKDLDFTVVEDADLPGELKEIIDEKKAEPFKITYSNQEAFYIVVGYGKQSSGGYSISVEDLYLTNNAIYVDTNLIGPSQDDLVSQGVTYPYIVIKTELTDKNVVFE